MREIQAAGDFAALRDLAARRGPLVDRVLRDLTAHLAQVGVTATGSGLDEVRTTLGAALADAAVDRQVRAGRVDRPLSYGGFGEVDMAVRSAAHAKLFRRVEGLAGPGRSSGEGHAGGCKEELAAAERERQAIESRGKEASAALRAARRRVETLETELDRARDALAVAEDEATRLKAQAAALTATIEQARKALAG